jgi:hypothetical protein
MTNSITTIGLDLAKSVFQVHCCDEAGNPVLKKRMRRGQVLSFFAKLPPCLIGMEACGGAHHWARELQKLGHEVRLIAPQFVRPFVKTNKNDAADAEAICEALTEARGDSRGIAVSENNAFTPSPTTNPIRNPPLSSNTRQSAIIFSPFIPYCENKTTPEREPRGGIRMVTGTRITQMHCLRSRAIPRFARALRKRAAALRLAPQASLLC